MNWIIPPPEKNEYFNDLTKAPNILHYNEPDENNELDNIVPYEKVMILIILQSHLTFHTTMSQIEIMKSIVFYPPKKLLC